MRRMDIQGLRALAVALVVAFHLMPKTLTGGYIGVDVFFVISGYLITRHLVKEASTSGQIQLGRFWARRIRRLLPAAYLVLAVSALGSFFLMPQSVLSQNLDEIFFASIYVLNWALSSNAVDYMASENATSIAQHYWSLSVEEQFYIFWPLLIIVALWIASKSKWLPRKLAIFSIIFIVFVGSLAYSIYETAHSQPSAYFMTTTRAWEFAAGALVAMAPVFALRIRSHALISWISLGVILTCAMFFDSKTSFPGWIALIPVIATATLLWVGDSTSTWSPQFLSRSGPVQFIGDTSYGIYLWHWPLIIFATAEIGRAPGWKWAIALASLTLLFAWATKRFVEDPIRSGRGFISRTGTAFAGMLIGIAVIACLTVIPNFIIQEEQRNEQTKLSELEQEITRCLGAHAIENNCTQEEIPVQFIDPALAANDQGQVYDPAGTCKFTNVNGTGEVFCRVEGRIGKTILIGDSHAGHYYPALSLVSAEDGFSLEARHRGGCNSFAPSAEGLSQVEKDCVKWGKQSWDAILTDETVERVIISNFTFGANDPSPATLKRVHEVISQLKKSKIEIVLIRDIPGVPLTPTGEKQTGPACLESGNDCSWIPPESTNDWLLSVAEEEGIPVFNTWQILCPKGTCQTVIGGLIAYYDTAHLTGAFSETMVHWFREQLKEVSAQRHGNIDNTRVK